MTIRDTLAAGISLLITCGAWAGGTPQGTAFNFQGSLKSGGTAFSGAAEFQFRLYDAITAGTQIGPQIALIGGSAPAVSDGLFSVTLNFGPAAFNGDARWLEIDVRTGLGSFTTLAPRQAVAAAPYAMYALAADGPNLTNLNASNLISGTVPGAQLAGTYANAMSLTHAANSIAGTFTGSGAAITNLNATNIAGGNLNVARLPTGGAWSLSSDLNLDANTLVVDQANNRVGFGTSAPGAKLDVQASNSSNVLFGRRTGGGLAHNLYIDSAGNGSMQLIDSAGTPRVEFANGLTYFNYGNVGIGTTAPNAPLHIASDPFPVITIQDTGLASSQVGYVSYRNNAMTETAWVGYGTANDPDFSIVNARSGGDIILSPLNGRVGIGTASPTHTLTVGGGMAVNRTTGDAMHYGAIPVLELNVTAPGNGQSFVRFSAGGLGNTVGNIAYVAGGGVSYNGFMGSHYGWIDGEHSIDRGALVRMTGDNRRLNDSVESDVVYGIEATASANDPACLGAYLGIMQSDKPADTDSSHLVVAVGNGEMLVVDSGTGDIQPGDYLISGDVAGCAMKDDPKRFPIGYVVARAAQRVAWAAVSPEADGRKVARVSVFFESFVRSDVQSVARTAENDAEIDMLRERVGALEALVHRLSQSR